MRLIIIIVTCDLRLLVPCSGGTHLRAKRGGYAANYAPKRVTRRDAREEAFVSRESHYFDEHASDPCFSSCFFFPLFGFYGFYGGDQRKARGCNYIRGNTDLREIKASLSLNGFLFRFERGGAK